MTELTRLLREIEAARGTVVRALQSAELRNHNRRPGSFDRRIRNHLAEARRCLLEAAAMVHLSQGKNP